MVWAATALAVVGTGMQIDSAHRGRKQQKKQNKWAKQQATSDYEAMLEMEAMNKRDAKENEDGVITMGTEEEIDDVIRI